MPKSIPFERLCITMKVVDGNGVEGRVHKLIDIHNVTVEYDAGGTGIYCLDINCEDHFYDPLYWREAEEYHSDIIDSLDAKLPNPDAFVDEEEYIDALLAYIERIKRDHEIEMEMMTIALEADDKKIETLNTMISNFFGEE